MSKEFREYSDVNSQHYWGKYRDVENLVNEVNDAFLDGPYLEYEDDYPYGHPHSELSQRIRYILGTVKADPLIPSQIREVIFECLDQITFVVDGVYGQALDDYYQHIKEGGELYETGSIDPDYQGFLNRVIDRLVANDCGVAEMEHRMNYINESIQVYLESFNPVKRKVKIKAYAAREPQPMRVVEIKW